MVKERLYEYRYTNRGGKGVKTINVTGKTGKLVGILDVDEKEDLMITCKSGVTIRMKVADISEQGRATQGVKLIKLDEGDEIAAITRLDDQHVGEIANGNGHSADIPAENKDENATGNSEISSDNGPQE
jgi:DNA gyrase subunit A